MRQPSPPSEWRELAWIDNEPVAYINLETSEIRQLTPQHKWETSWGAPGLGWFYQTVPHPLQEPHGRQES